MAYQSLYRRYRPQTFAEMRGQEHVVKAMQNAVRDDRVGHAYLLSGPRGTGKTTAARILAKVLNCTNVTDGEPCGECESCVSIENGTSFDLHELDAASNNKVDDIRDLLSKVALGTPGRTKVYLLDEVHMLTAGAENALLKTLEEPPDHVIFVLATTEPHKVVPTIRSRTQHLQLTLIPAEQMLELVREVAADAGLDVDDEVVEFVVKAGGGSARDTLSALDQVVAAGGVSEVDSSTGELLEALASNDSGRAIAAIEAATTLGIDPRRIGERFIDALRSAFLVRMGSAPARLSEAEAASAQIFAGRLTPATMTRALETIGKSLVDMRQAPDPRIDLEVAFVRITQPATSGDIDGLIVRLEALESAMTSGAAPGPAAGTATAPADMPADQSATAGTAPAPSPAPASSSSRGGGANPAAKARAALKPKAGPTDAAAPSVGSDDTSETPPTSPPAASAPLPPSMRREQGQREPAPEAAPTSAEPAEPDSPTLEAEPEPSTAPASHDEGTPASAPANVSFDTIRDGWGPLLDGQATKIRARFLAGAPLALDGATVTVTFPTDTQIERCRPFVPQVEAALSDAYGTPLSLALTTGDAPAAATSAPAAAAADLPDDHEVDLHDLTDAADQGSTVVDRIADVFPGAEVMPSSES